MNPVSVSLTPENTVRYPLHQHSTWEIMYYLSGNGYMATESGNLPFQKGSIVIIPPKVSHGSVSENGFVNISVSGDFSHLLMFDTPQRLCDSETKEGETLARLILQNRYADKDYLSALCRAYVLYLLQNATQESAMDRCIASVIRQIDEGYANLDLNVADLLRQSGYAEDYIRAEFKRVTSLTPTRFLTNIRIKRAAALLEIYGPCKSVAEIAEACGFRDPVYFSKQFKRLMGISPAAYMGLSH